MRSSLTALQLPLFLACLQSNLDSLETLISNGEDVQHKVRSDFRYMIDCQLIHVQVINVHFMNVSPHSRAQHCIQDSQGRTALHAAAFTGFVEGARLLIANGVSSNRRYFSYSLDAILMCFYRGACEREGQELVDPLSLCMRQRQRGRSTTQPHCSDATEFRLSGDGRVSRVTQR